MKIIRTLQTGALALLLSTPLAFSAGAQGMPGIESNKCLAGKSRCVFQLAKRLAKCDDKCILNPKNCEDGLRACKTKALDKFTGGSSPERGCFGKLEGKEDSSKPASLCLTSGDADTVGAAVQVAVDDLVSILIPGVCGDGEVNEASEQCDGDDVDGATCSDFGHNTGQVSCDNSCQYDSSTCATCTKDVFECPDGSFVGRTAPDCAFAPCPCEQYGIDCPIVSCASDLCDDGVTAYGCTGECYFDASDGSCSGVTPMDVCFE